MATLSQTSQGFKIKDTNVLAQQKALNEKVQD